MIKVPGVFSIRHKDIDVSITKLEKLLELQAERQNRRCACCGVTIPAAVGPIFIDGDGTNLSQENLAAACQPCEALHNSGKRIAGVDPGILVYLPNISQVDLIALAHAVRAAMHFDPNNTSIYSKLKGELRRTSEIAQLKLNFADSASLASYAMRLPPKAYANREKLFGPIRWFPLFPGPGYTAEGNTYLEGFASKKELENM